MTLIQTNRARLSRRTLLRGLGGVAIALPFLDAMRPPKAHADAPQAGKRFIVMYTPNGVIADNFWPTAATSETNFTLGPILQPLATYKQDLLLLHGVDMLSSLSGPGDAHQKGTGQCLTGTELLEGDFIGDGGASAGWAGGISVDQAIANHIGADSRFRSLELGVAVQGSSVKARINYRDAGQPLPPENSPYAAYERLFGDSLGDPLAIERRKARRTMVLDAVADQHRALDKQLGKEDREKLENHLLSIDAIRARLDKGTVEFDGMACRPLELGAPLDVNLVANMPLIGELQMELLAMAMACDLTRVATLMWTNSTAGHVLSFIDAAIKEGHHTLAHKGDEDTVKNDLNTKISTWYAEQLAYLIEKLDGVYDVDGNTLFSNSVILWTNEQNKGNNHSRFTMPYVLAGSAGGYFKTGRYIKYFGEYSYPEEGEAQKKEDDDEEKSGEPPTDIGHNRLLVSLCNSMGIETEEFGDPRFGSGPLDGLT